MPPLLAAVRPRRVSCRRWSLGLWLRAEASSGARPPGPATTGAQAGLLPTLSRHPRLWSTSRPRRPALQQAQLQEIPSGAVQSSWRPAAWSRPLVSVPCKRAFFVLKGRCGKAAVTPGTAVILLLLRSVTPSTSTHGWLPAINGHPLLSPLVRHVPWCSRVAECGIMWAMRGGVIL